MYLGRRLKINIALNPKKNRNYCIFIRTEEYFTTWYGMIHQKRGGMLHVGYELKEQEMTM